MSSIQNSHARGFITLSRMLVNLKRVKRTGWIDRGIPELKVESVADHSLAVALMAWAAALEAKALGATLDSNRVALLAMIHDLPEAETGDPPPYHPSAIPSEEEGEERRKFLNQRHLRDENRQRSKREAEGEALRRLVAALPVSSAREIRSLWDELQRGESEEARFVKQADRLETYLQSRVYAEDFPSAPMASFQKEVRETVADPFLAAVRDLAIRRDTLD